MTEAVNLAIKVEKERNRSSLRTSNNFRRPALDLFSTPRGSATSTNRDISKDAQGTHNSTRAQGRVAAPTKADAQGRNQETEQNANKPYARPNLGKSFREKSLKLCQNPFGPV